MNHLRGVYGCPWYCNSTPQSSCATAASDIQADTSLPSVSSWPCLLSALSGLCWRAGDPRRAFTRHALSALAGLCFPTARRGQGAVCKAVRQPKRCDIPILLDRLHRWQSGNIIECISEVVVRQAGLVLRWVTICRYNWATQANSAWPSLCGRHNEYWQWWWPLLRKNWQVLRSSRPQVPTGLNWTAVLWKNLLSYVYIC